jgi:hypothetical protein
LHEVEDYRWRLFVGGCDLKYSPSSSRQGVLLRTCCRCLVEQTCFESSFGMIRKPVLCKYALQLGRLHTWVSQKADTDALPLVYQRGEGEMPFTRFFEALNHLVLIADLDASAFERLNE